MTDKIDVLSQLKQAKHRMVTLARTRAFCVNDEDPL